MIKASMPEPNALQGTSVQTDAATKYVCCPSCGLATAGLHGSDAECVAALRMEIARVSAVLQLAYPRSA